MPDAFLAQPFPMSEGIFSKIIVSQMLFGKFSYDHCNFYKNQCALSGYAKFSLFKQEK